MSINPLEVQGKNYWEKLGGLHWFWIGLVVMILLSIPLLRPLGLPISTTKWTVDAFEVLKNIPKDKYVLWEDVATLSDYADFRPGHVALWRILLKYNVKFLVYGTGPDNPPFQLRIQDEALKSVEASGKVYGVDWVHCSYITGGEVGEAAMAANIHGTFPFDNQGNTIDSLPMMRNLRDYRDVAILISSSSSGSWIESPTRQWYAKFGVKIVSYPCTGGAVLSSTYYPNKGVVGIIEGSRGGAELEFLGGVYGSGVALSDAKTLAYTTVLAFIIIGNISYWGGRAQITQKRKEI